MVGKGVIGSIVGIAAVAFALVVSGCGGGGGSSLSKAEYVKKAGEICARSESERQEVVTAASKKLTPGKKVTSAQQEQVVLEVVPTYEKMASEIDELGAPEGGEKKAEAWVEAMEETAENIKADPGTVITGNTPFQKPDELAEELGVKRCVV